MKDESVLGKTIFFEQFVARIQFLSKKLERTHLLLACRACSFPFCNM